DRDERTDRRAGRRRGVTVGQRGRERDRHDRADGQVDASGREDEAHPEGEQQVAHGAARDVDELADRVAAAAADAWGARAHAGAPEPQRDGRDGRPEDGGPGDPRERPVHATASSPAAMVASRRPTVTESSWVTSASFPRSRSTLTR